MKQFTIGRVTMPADRAIGILLSGYEFYALTTQRSPAITDLLRRHPTLGAAAVGWLAMHLLPGGWVPIIAEEPEP
jgi:hypothetical protein